MTVTTAMPWPVRLIFAGVMLGLGALVALWLYEHGRALAGRPPPVSVEEVQQLRQQLAAASAERDKLRATALAAESRLNMEQSAQQQLSAQLKKLETENSRLKEDVAFFETLLPVDARTSGVAIRRIEAQAVAPNRLQYRMLVMQGGKKPREFQGNLQISVSVVQNGRPAVMNFPEGKSAEINNFRLGFRHYQRVEGQLILPEGATAKSLQAKILENGQVRAQQTLNL